MTSPGATESSDVIPTILRELKCDLRQRATQNCDRQNSEIYLENATPCDRSAVAPPEMSPGVATMLHTGDPNPFQHLPV